MAGAAQDDIRNHPVVREAQERALEEIMDFIRRELRLELTVENDIRLYQYRFQLRATLDRPVQTVFTVDGMSLHAPRARPPVLVTTGAAIQHPPNFPLSALAARTPPTRPVSSTPPVPPVQPKGRVLDFKEGGED